MSQTCFSSPIQSLNLHFFLSLCRVDNCRCGFFFKRDVEMEVFRWKKACWKSGRWSMTKRPRLASFPRRTAARVKASLFFFFSFSVPVYLLDSALLKHFEQLVFFCFSVAICDVLKNRSARFRRLILTRVDRTRGWRKHCVERKKASNAKTNIVNSKDRYRSRQTKPSALLSHYISTSACVMKNGAWLKFLFVTRSEANVFGRHNCILVTNEGTNCICLRLNITVASVKYKAIGSILGPHRLHQIRVAGRPAHTVKCEHLCRTNNGWQRE